MGLITPLVGDGRKLKRIGIISLTVYGVYVLGSIASLLFMVPSITEINNTLSIYVVARNVSLGTFIQRIDAIFILTWVMSIFNYLAIIMHFTLTSFKKVVKIKDENAMVYCFASFLFIISMLPRNISDIAFFEGTVYKYSSIIFVFLICLPIFICGYIKKKHELKKGVKHLEETH